MACASPPLGQRDRGFAERLRVVVDAPPRHARRATSATPPGVTIRRPRMIASSVCTARPGTPGGGLPREHDRVHAVVHGIGGVVDFGARRARLGRHRLEHLGGDDDRHAAARARRVMSFCARGTCSSGISSPRSPRATITASRPRGSRRGCSSACGRSSLAISGTSRGVRRRRSLARAAAGRRRSARSSGPPCRRRARGRIEIVDVLRVIADAGSGTPGALIPLCSPSSPPSTTVVRISRAVGVSTRSSISAVGEQQPIARPHAPRQAGECRRDPSRAADEIAGRDAERVARLQRERPAALERPVRIFGPLRSCRMATSRPGRAAAARAPGRNVAACDSCVPCEKLSRKMSVPAAMSASSIASESLAGPIVAIIFVRRISSFVVRVRRSAFGGSRSFGVRRSRFERRTTNR